MTEHDFLQLDVFADAPGRGNPLGVVFGADGLDAAAMQAIAAWLNLSESSFVLPPSQAGADYRLRIFTPRQELPFAGHPSVGVAVFARCEGQPFALVVRAFVPADGIPEDPVTGSANAAIAAWLHANDALPAPRFRSSQGREMGRDGVVEIEVDAEGEAWIGGLTQTIVEGRLAW